MTKKKLALKVICAAIAFVLIFFIFFILNSFVGNPISSTIAKNKIEAYVSENYDISDLELGKTWYNFKDGKYQIRIKSKTSKHTDFYIAYGRHEIYDSYLSGEVGCYLTDIIRKEYSYEGVDFIFHFGRFEKSMIKQKIHIPIDLNNIPVEVNLNINAYSDNPSKEESKKLMIEAYRIMKKNNISIANYSVSLRKPNMTDEDFKHTDEWSLSGIPASEIAKW
ncbi:hypothetical protein RBG61_03730 [Paludicola sp. MB14-C6]|uniref:YfjL-like protein n=1 Tax=Paludihabitans sp. MB14-C6 TaxID=3070656 RepID=UPI0027DCE5AD|nr:hypothetical protein [Paludicola sp. MB14-C6]WMJ23785.1 hypothetical protein RBG61_03730 [Paludicola sp. MB14-C6]